MSVVKVTVEIPLLDKVVEQGYSLQQELSGRLRFAGHLDLKLDPEQARTFVRLREALKQISAKMPCGRPVVSNSDVLKWLMDHLHASEQAGGSEPLEIPKPVSLLPQTKQSAKRKSVQTSAVPD